MRKIIAAMNMTLDGFCDHTLMTADDEIHRHYNELLNGADVLVYGRITYQLMESYWPTVINNPTGDKEMDEFATIIDQLPKLVFSHTLTGPTWRNSKLASRSFQQELVSLKQQGGRDILVGSPSLIAASLDLGLVDEFQICIQPIIAGKGLVLLKDISHRIDLRLIKTKMLNKSGSVVIYYMRGETVAV